MTPMGNWEAMEGECGDMGKMQPGLSSGYKTGKEWEE